MKITVILCTYNRCRSLPRALESVARSLVPESLDWEVLVVDNNSSDETRFVVGEFRRRFPGRFLYLFEPQPGKSFALNSGIRESKADAFAFMDDDVEVAPRWLDNLTKHLMSGTWSGAGGRILPESGFVPPRWMETEGRYALAPLAIFDRGSAGGELNEAPFGTNMAFRRDMFSMYGGFRTDLGPLPGSDIRHNEDSEFGTRLLAAGERFWYEPAAVVYHSVPKERVRKDYFLSWWFDKVRADIRQDGVPKGTKYYVAGVPLYMLRRLCVWSLRWVFAFNPRRRFACKLNVWKLAGMIKECHRRAVVEVLDADRIAQDIGSPTVTPSK